MNEVWQVGDVKITRVVEMEVAGGSRFILPDATREACLEYPWMQPYFMDNAGNLIMSIHALVVETSDRRIVVDTCIGNDKERSIPNWSHLQTTFLEDLAAAGYPPETIDTVLCTHLHVDHVGWNTRLVDGVRFLSRHRSDRRPDCRRARPLRPRRKLRQLALASHPAPRRSRDRGEAPTFRCIMVEDRT